MPTIDEIRKKYPQYGDLTDTALADSLHSKFYSDVPRDQFNAKIGLAAAPQEQPSVMGDVASSFGRGVIKGAIGVAGIPGDVANLGNKGVDYVERKMGLDPGPLNSPVGSSGQIQKGVEKATGPLGEAKTTPGKYAESVGEFVPSAALGPGGPLTKAATTVLGGVGSEVGGEALGPWGRFLGGALGGGAAGLAGAESQSMKLAAKLPSKDAIKASAKQAYDAVSNARLVASQPAIDRFTTDLRAILDNDLITDTVAPRTFKAIEKLQGAGGDIAQMMGIRQKLGEITPAAGTEHDAANAVKDAIDTFIDNLPPHEVVAGDPKFTQAMLDHARSSWRAYAKLDQVQSAMEVGSHTAAVTGVGANTQNAMRQRIRQILDSDKNARGFSSETKDQMEKIVMGTWLTNVARTAGKYAPSGPVSSIATGAAFFGGGPIMAATVAIPATIAKYLGTYLTKRQISELEDMIRAESPTGKPIAAANAAQAPNFSGIAPAAALRSALSTGAASPLAGSTQ